MRKRRWDRRSFRHLLIRSCFLLSLEEKFKDHQSVSSRETLIQLITGKQRFPMDPGARFSCVCPLAVRRRTSPFSRGLFCSKRTGLRLLWPIASKRQPIGLRRIRNRRHHGRGTCALIDLVEQKPAASLTNKRESPTLPSLSPVPCRRTCPGLAAITSPRRATRTEIMPWHTCRLAEILGAHGQDLRFLSESVVV